MKKLLALIIPLLIAGLLYYGYQLIYNAEKEASAIQVTSTPVAQVYVDNKPLGKTPLYNDKLTPGDHTVKLIPEGDNLLTYEEKVNLKGGVLTVIDRIFRATEAESENSTISLEALPQKKGVQVAVVTSPDGVEVKLNNQIQGVTPLSLTSLLISDHQITLSKPGYTEKIIRIRPADGYKLIVNAKLGVSTLPDATPSAAINPTPAVASQSATIRILQTPTGFLRVRAEPNTSAVEIGKVNPNETYPMVAEQDEWYEIKLQDGKQGWITKQYAKKDDQ